MIDYLIEEIWIEAEYWEEWDFENDNTDVIVTFNNKKRYVACFFTLKNVEKLLSNWKQSGECLSGKYFWASDFILIDRCSRLDIEKVIYHLIIEGDFENIFREIDVADNE